MKKFIWDFEITSAILIFFSKKFFSHMKDLVAQVTEIGVRGFKN